MKDYKFFLLHLHLLTSRLIGEKFYHPLCANIHFPKHKKTMKFSHNNYLHSLSLLLYCVYNDVSPYPISNTNFHLNTIYLLFILKIITFCAKVNKARIVHEFNDYKVSLCCIPITHSICVVYLLILFFNS